MRTHSHERVAFSHSQSHTSEGKPTKKKKTGRIRLRSSIVHCDWPRAMLKPVDAVAKRRLPTLSFDVRCAQPHFIARPCAGVRVRVLVYACAMRCASYSEPVVHTPMQPPNRIVFRCLCVNSTATAARSKHKTKSTSERGPALHSTCDDKNRKASQRLHVVGVGSIILLYVHTDKLI